MDASNRYAENSKKQRQRNVNSVSALSVAFWVEYTYKSPTMKFERVSTTLIFFVFMFIMKNMPWAHLHYYSCLTYVINYTYVNFANFWQRETKNI